MARGAARGALHVGSTGSPTDAHRATPITSSPTKLVSQWAQQSKRAVGQALLGIDVTSCDGDFVTGYVQHQRRLCGAPHMAALLAPVLRAQSSKLWQASQGKASFERYSPEASKKERRACVHSTHGLLTPLDRRGHRTVEELLRVSLATSLYCTPGPATRRRTTDGTAPTHTSLSRYPFLQFKVLAGKFLEPALTAAQEVHEIVCQKRGVV